MAVRGVDFPPGGIRKKKFTVFVEIYLESARKVLGFHSVHLQRGKILTILECFGGVRFKLIFECLNTDGFCWEATGRCKLLLCWVPGHSGISGNEPTDRLGGETCFIGFKIFLFF